LKIVFKNGIKWKNDRKTILRCSYCNHDHDLNYSELACMVWSLYWNENIGYPRPEHKGGFMIESFLFEVDRNIPNKSELFNERIIKIMKKYKFPKMNLPIIIDNTRKCQPSLFNE